MARVATAAVSRQRGKVIQFPNPVYGIGGKVTLSTLTGQKIGGFKTGGIKIGESKAVRGTLLVTNAGRSKFLLTGLGLGNKGGFITSGTARQVLKRINMSATGNPHFRGKLGTGTRFDNCVKKMSRQPGVYDPEGLCASFGRKKYGAKRMAKMARNPKLGTVQAAVLRALRASGSTDVRLSTFDSPSSMRKILDSLVKKGLAKKSGKYTYKSNPGLLATATAAAAGGAVGAYHSDQAKELAERAGELARGALASGREAVERVRKENPSIGDAAYDAGYQVGQQEKRKHPRSTSPSNYYSVRKSRAVARSIADELLGLYPHLDTKLERKGIEGRYQSLYRSGYLKGFRAGGEESNPIFWHVPVPAAPPKMQAFHKLRSAGKSAKVGGVRVTPADARVVIEAFNSMSGEDQRKYTRMSVKKMVQLAPFYSESMRRQFPNPLARGKTTKAQLKKAIAYAKKMQIENLPLSTHGEHSWSDKRVELEMELWDRFGEGKKNPESSSAALSASFHGVPAHSITEIHSREHRHTWLAQLGTLTELVVRTVSGYKAVLNFKGSGNKEVFLASAENGKQLFFEGGDQSLDLRKLHLDSAKWKRDSMVIGTLEKITYRTRKKMHRMETINYYHKAGEDSKVRPLLLYDTLNQRLSLAGGQYVVKAPGIIN